MKKILFILLASALLAVSGFFYLTKNDRTLYSVTPQTGPAVQAVYASGSVEPTVMLPIAPRTGAHLVALLSDEGAEVQKGDVLAQLEDTDVQKAIEELSAKLDLAQKEFNRKNALKKTGAISKQALDTARSNLNAAKAALEQAQAQQDYLRLTAPEDGRIIKRDGEVGEFIPTGQAVFWMECCAPMRITVDVDEEDIPLVAVGQRVIISADAYADETFEGHVDAITPMGDSVSRSYRVRIGLAGDTPLMTGMTAEANIITRQDDNALLIPATAVRGGKVWVVENGKASIRKIKIGAQNDGAVEVLEGLSKDEAVLEKADPEITEGQDIQTKSRAWTPAT